MGDYWDNAWFVPFMTKLLQGDRETLGLLRFNPFADHPPRFVRATLYKYEFTSPEERRQSGQWWKRQYVRDYLPAISLRGAAPGMKLQ